jgi:hypothetical protein
MPAPAPRVVRLEHILPYNSTRAVYDNAVACFLSLCDSWAVCPRYQREVTEWLCVYQGIWVGHLHRHISYWDANFCIAASGRSNCALCRRDFA